MEIGIAGIVKFLGALVFVLSLMGGLAIVMKKFGLGNATLTSRAGKRMKLVEVMTIDARRKAVILECDDEQHLIILGHTGDTVVKNNIPKRIVSNENAFKDAA